MHDVNWTDRHIYILCPVEQWHYTTGQIIIGLLCLLACLVQYFALPNYLFSAFFHHFPLLLQLSIHSMLGSQHLVRPLPLISLTLHINLQMHFNFLQEMYLIRSVSICSPYGGVWCHTADVLAQVGMVVDVVVAIGLTFGVCVAVTHYLVL